MLYRISSSRWARYALICDSDVTICKRSSAAVGFDCLLCTGFWCILSTCWPQCRPVHVWQVHGLLHLLQLQLQQQLLLLFAHSCPTCWHPSTPALAAATALLPAAATATAEACRSQALMQSAPAAPVCSSCNTLLTATYSLSHEQRAQATRRCSQTNSETA